ncbi:hypothetical protein DAI22_09g019800 [Oryza sativa Japonica Group]|nr:hypothetical protein DAI22_09g019800 [Oryza sativa Japonica Group]
MTRAGDGSTATSSQRITGATPGHHCNTMGTRDAAGGVPARLLACRRRSLRPPPYSPTAVPPGCLPAHPAMASSRPPPLLKQPPSPLKRTRWEKNSPPRRLSPLPTHPEKNERHRGVKCKRKSRLVPSKPPGSTVL